MSFLTNDLLAGSSPTVLWDMSMPQYQVVTFGLIEGQLIYDNHYHTWLNANEVRLRPKQHVHPSHERLEPLSLGKYIKEPWVTIREGLNRLHL